MTYTGYVSNAGSTAGSSHGERPCAVLLWSGDGPMLRYVSIPTTGLVLGREVFPESTDDRLSRQHAKLMWNGRQFEITDLGSRNGTSLAGAPLVHRSATAAARAVVRTGRTVVLLSATAAPALPHQVDIVDGIVVGVSSRSAFQGLLKAASHRKHVCILGEHGTGKTLYARAIAKRSGDAVAIFDPSVHAIPFDRVIGKATTIIVEQIGKIGENNRAALRVMMKHRPEVRVVCTSTVGLQDAGVPDDLRAQLEQQTIQLAPLRDRFDELPVFLRNTVHSVEPSLHIHSTLAEASLLRPWPSNLHDFLAHLQRCAQSVAAQGKSHIRGDDLATEAGQLMMGAPTIQTGAQQTMMTALRASKRKPSDD
jgi:transcriptional regulator of acetoin/glycerol metabolism